MRDHRKAHGLPVFTFGVLGLVIGHGIAYLIAIPDSARRAAVLHETGHAYLPLLAEIGLILAIAGVASLVARALVSRKGIREGPFARTAVHLAALQIGAFVILEVGERLLTGMPLLELVSDHLLAVGAVVQLGVAILGALILRASARGAIRLASAFVAPRTPRPSGLITIAFAHTLGLHPELVGAVGVRGPPLP